MTITNQTATHDNGLYNRTQFSYASSTSEYTADGCMSKLFHVMTVSVIFRVWSADPFTAH